MRRNERESDFQRQIIDFARLTGWLIFHPHKVQTPSGWLTTVQGHPGYPDLTLVHPRRRELLFLELKTERGRLQPEQVQWLDALAAVEAPPIVRVCRPSDWDWIQAILAPR